jgi:hypothetical protein
MYCPLRIVVPLWMRPMPDEGGMRMKKGREEEAQTERSLAPVVLDAAEEERMRAGENDKQTTAICPEKR